jgi:DNA polymerase III epsilon subunit-like protein
MPLLEGDVIVVFDFETNGLSPMQHVVIEIGHAILRVGKAKIVAVKENGGGLMLCDKCMPRKVQTLTGITPQMCRKGGVSLGDRLDTMVKDVDSAKEPDSARVFFLGHNSDTFDLRFLYFYFANAGALTFREWLSSMNVVGTLDSLKFIGPAKVVDGTKGRCKQSALYEAFFGRPMKNAHRAHADVAGLVEILQSPRCAKLFNGDGKHKIARTTADWFRNNDRLMAVASWELERRREVAKELRDGVVKEPSPPPIISRPKSRRETREPVLKNPRRSSTLKSKNYRNSKKVMG